LQSAVVRFVFELVASRNEVLTVFYNFCAAFPFEISEWWNRTGPSNGQPPYAAGWIKFETEKIFHGANWVKAETFTKKIFCQFKIYQPKVLDF